MCACEPSGASFGDWPHNLTHCCVCDKPFPEPVEDWDDYFFEIEDASFACEPCGKAEGYPDA